MVLLARRLACAPANVFQLASPPGAALFRLKDILLSHDQPHGQPRANQTPMPSMVRPAGSSVALLLTWDSSLTSAC